MKYRFVRRYRRQHSVEVLCRISKVSISAYYDWLKNRCYKKPRNLRILRRILRIMDRSSWTYGINRVWNALRKYFRISISRKTVQKIMHDNGIKAKTTKKYHPYPKTTEQNPKYYPNILDQNFDEKQPNKVWLADITYLKIGEKWGYLAATIDLASKKIVGWALSRNPDSRLVTDALNIAILCENPEKGLIVHSDRGTQFTSKRYAKLLEKNEFVGSMSRSGVPYDNAPMEAFFKSFKSEFANHEKFRSIKEAEDKIRQWINQYYNYDRLHSSIGYMPPGIYHYLNIRGLLCPRKVVYTIFSFFRFFVFRRKTAVCRKRAGI